MKSVGLHQLVSPLLHQLLDTLVPLVGPRPLLLNVLDVKLPRLDEGLSLLIYVGQAVLMAQGVGHDQPDVSWPGSGRWQDPCRSHRC